MNASLPPESGIPPSGDEFRYITTEHSLAVKRMLIRDCLGRALDALDRDNPRDVDWLYVYDQLTRADEQVVSAHLLAQNAGLDVDEDEVDTPLVPNCGHASTDPDEFIDYKIEGGGA